MSLPEYENTTLTNEHEQLNKVTIQLLRDKLDSIEDLDKYGIDDNHQVFIRQIMKSFNKKFIYEGFHNDYKYIVSKLSTNITVNNNHALRSVCEALES